MGSASSLLSKLDVILSELPAPTPIITMMGDFNFPKETVKWVRSDEGLLFPDVANHREGEMVEGKQDRLQDSQPLTLPPSTV